MEKVFNFDDIRPYEGDEVPAAVMRLAHEEPFIKAVAHIVPDIEKFLRILGGCHTVEEFQSRLAMPIMSVLVQNTASGLTNDGFSRLSRQCCYTYISNHRDITLDSAFLNLVLYTNGFATSEIAIGDNLLIYPWIVDFVRLNKSFIVNRSVSRRQMLEVLCRLSAYMHHAIQDKKESIWIAQREGRAKNSDDRTQESLVKMMALGGGGDALSNLRSLNLVPVAISYEYDPCDYLKAKEMQQKRDDATYCKQPSDDLANMVTGITGQKGHIHFEAAAPIDELLAKIAADVPHSELFSVAGGIIDRAIHSHYRLYPGNYVAYDKLWGGGAMSRYYTMEEQSAFESYIQSRIDKIELVQKDEPFLRERLYEMYANPVRNQLDAASFSQE